MAILPRQLHDLLDVYHSSDPREAGFLEAMRALAAVGEPSTTRHHFTPGHFTASAFVLSPDRRQIALLFHPKLKRWLQPGGHLEGEDTSPLAAARREIAEEIGQAELTVLGDGLFDLDVHDIPANPREPAHQHFDLRFAFVAATWTLNGEHEARWVPLESVDAVESDASVMRAVGKLLG